ncbi:MAG: hypothetical protein KF859_05715 [Phycisphaeraceae bacterium]|nr:hypothetical protein [Phycisphaeraceae bacterium]
MRLVLVILALLLCGRLWPAAGIARACDGGARFAAVACVCCAAGAEESALSCCELLNDPAPAPVEPHHPGCGCEAGEAPDVTLPQGVAVPRADHGQPLPPIPAAVVVAAAAERGPARRTGAESRPPTGPPGRAALCVWRL